jgi:hypothetical protein
MTSHCRRRMTPEQQAALPLSVTKATARRLERLEGLR